MAINRVEFAADDSVVATHTLQWGFAAWDTTTGALLAEAPPGKAGIAGNDWDDIRFVAATADGALVLGMPTPELIDEALTSSGSAVPFRILDVATGDVSTTPLLKQAPSDWAMTSDGTRLYVADEFNNLNVIDTATWETLESHPLAQGGTIWGLDLSPDESLLAIVALDEFVRVWDTEARALAAEIPVDGAIGNSGLMGVTFLDDSTLIVLPSSGETLLRFTLDPDELLRLLSDRALRGFTEAECRTYGLDPCPSLEDIRHAEFQPRADG